jgi:Protein of unknown function (DUF664)
MPSPDQPPDLTSDLQHYLRQGRQSVLDALDGLSEYDSRRPMTPTGTNVLGLVKHLAGIEIDYLGNCVGRPFPATRPWVEDGTIWDGADMWATPGQSRAYLVELYQSAGRHADESIALLPLDAPGAVSWWPEQRRATTFGHLLVRVIAETAQHAGHIDILRETIDGRGGRDHDDIGDGATWSSYVATVQAAADTFRD